MQPSTSSVLVSQSDCTSNRLKLYSLRGRSWSLTEIWICYNLNRKPTVFFFGDFLAAYPWTNFLDANLVHWLYLTDVKLPPDPNHLLGKLTSSDAPHPKLLNTSFLRLTEPLKFSLQVVLTRYMHALRPFTVTSDSCCISMKIWYQRSS